MATAVDEALFVEEEEVGSRAQGGGPQVGFAGEGEVVLQIGGDALGGLPHILAEIHVKIFGFEHVGAMANAGGSALSQLMNALVQLCPNTGW